MGQYTRVAAHQPLLAKPKGRVFFSFGAPREMAQPGWASQRLGWHASSAWQVLPSPIARVRAVGRGEPIVSCGMTNACHRPIVRAW